MGSMSPSNASLIYFMNNMLFKSLSDTILAWKLLQNISDLELIKYLLEVMQFMLLRNI